MSGISRGTVSSLLGGSETVPLCVYFVQKAFDPNILHFLCSFFVAHLVCKSL